MIREVSFLSSDERVMARLLEPEGHGPWPAVVLCPDFASPKEVALSTRLVDLTIAGCAVLAIDYRFTGSSGGEPHAQALPSEQVEDVRHAITFLQKQSGVDPNRIGLVGIGLGGGVALQAAAMDPRVHSVTAIAPVTDGAKWLRAAQGPIRWRNVQQRLLQDYLNRSRTGYCAYVPAVGSSPEAILPTNPEVTSWLDGWHDRLPTVRRLATLRSMEAILGFRPIAFADLIAGRACCIIASNADTVVPADQAIAYWQHCAEPRRLVMLPAGLEVDHHQLLEGPSGAFVLAETVSWIRSSLVGEREPTDKVSAPNASRPSQPSSDKLSAVSPASLTESTTATPQHGGLPAVSVEDQLSTMASEVAATGAVDEGAAGASVESTTDEQEPAAQIAESTSEQGDTTPALTTETPSTDEANAEGVAKAIDEPVAVTDAEPIEPQAAIAETAQEHEAPADIQASPDASEDTAPEASAAQSEGEVAVVIAAEEQAATVDAVGAAPEARETAQEHEGPAEIQASPDAAEDTAPEASAAQPEGEAALVIAAEEQTTTMDAVGADQQAPETRETAQEHEGPAEIQASPDAAEDTAREASAAQPEGKAAVAEEHAAGEESRSEASGDAGNTPASD